MTKQVEESIKDQKQSKARQQENPIHCGIIMPISDSPNLRPGHWEHVLKILELATHQANLVPRIVSKSDETNIIQKNIVSHIYSDPIILCDVSTKNPNVMFELGLALAFGKHVVIVKDDETSIPFDINVIEYVEYPRDLRYPLIEKFILELTKKISSTYKCAKSEEKSPFINHFKQIEVKKLDRESVGEVEFLGQQIGNLANNVARIENNIKDKISFEAFNNAINAFIRESPYYADMIDPAAIDNSIIYTPNKNSLDTYRKIKNVRKYYNELMNKK